MYAAEWHATHILGVFTLYLPTPPTAPIYQTDVCVYTGEKSGCLRSDWILYVWAGNNGGTRQYRGYNVPMY